MWRVLFLGLALVAGQTTTIPWQFATDGTVNSNAKVDGQNPYYFIMHLCDGLLYHNRTVWVSVNLFSHEWSTEAHHCISVTAFGKRGFIATNDHRSSGGEVDADFSWVYNMADGDVRFEAVNCGGNNDWTLSTAFSDSQSGKLILKPNKRGQRSPLLDAPTANASRRVGFEPLKDYNLIPFMSTNAVYTVKTRGFKSFSMTHCSTDMSYTLSIVVNAIDSHSAMSTYVCTTSPCTAAKAVASDESASALNFVDVQTSSGSLQKYEVTVEGYGRYEELNSFQVLAQIKRK
jgi:hypothetical protein